MPHNQLTAPSPSAPAPCALTPQLLPKRPKSKKSKKPKLPPQGCALPGIVTGGGAPDDLWAQPLPDLQAFWHERLGDGFLPALEVLALGGDPSPAQEPFVQWGRQASGRYARAGVALSLLAAWWLSSPEDLDQALSGLADPALSKKPLAPYLAPEYPSEDVRGPLSEWSDNYILRCEKLGCGLTDLGYGASSLVTLAWFDPASRRLLHARIEGHMDDVDLDQYGEIGDCCGGPQFAGLIGSMTWLGSLEIMSLSPRGAQGVFLGRSAPRSLQISKRQASAWLRRAERRLPGHPTELGLLELSGAASGLRFTS